MTMIGTMIAERYFPKRAMQGQTVIDFCERPYWHRLWVFQEIRRGVCRRVALFFSVVVFTVGLCFALGTTTQQKPYALALDPLDPE